jgi:hypothetical protein
MFILYLKLSRVRDRKKEKHLSLSSMGVEKRPKLITYLQLLVQVNLMSMSIHISIFYLRRYIISHNSQCGYISGTLKHKFVLMR